jgi:tetratricopeptide (TPR) repeat protein
MILVEDLKQELRSWQAFAQVLSGLIIIICGAFSFLFKLLDSFIPVDFLTLSRLLLIYVGISILLWKITSIIISSRLRNSLITTGSGNTLHKYSKKQRLTAKTIRWMMLLLVPIFFIYGFRIKKNSDNACLKKTSKMGISVSRFSQNLPDEFSNNLINFLAEKTSRDTTIVLEFNDRFLGAQASLNPMDSLVPLINCFNRGFVIFGSRNRLEENFFCNIFMNNRNQQLGKVRLVGDTMFRIMEPKLIKFDIISQAKTVGEFILSQIYYEQGEYKRSLTVLDSIFSKDSAQLTSQMKAQSYLLKGNNFFQIGEYEAAKKSYSSGFLADNRNEILRINQFTATKALEVKNELDQRQSGIKIIQVGTEFSILNEEGDTIAYGIGSPIRYKTWVIFPYNGKWCAIISRDGQIKEAIHEGKSLKIVKDSLDKFLD